MRRARVDEQREAYKVKVSKFYEEKDNDNSSKRVRIVNLIRIESRDELKARSKTCD